MRQERFEVCYVHVAILVLVIFLMILLHSVMLRIILVKGVIRIPRYIYKCYLCDEEVEETCTISKCPESVSCPKCGKQIFQHFGDRKMPNSFKDSPRVSRAMGVLPNQIEAATKRWPGSRYDKSGNLLIQNRTEKKLRMKQRNYCEY